MAKFRMVHTEFWNDPKVVEEFSPEDKFFFLYLLTNSKTTQIGIYQITKKQIAFDTGYSIESINSIMDRFINHHQLIKYNAETREIAIKNWGKYNLNRGGKPVMDCVKSELNEVKDKDLIHFVGERIEKQEIKILFIPYNESSNDSQDESSNDTTNDTSHDSKNNKNEESKDIKGSYDTSNDSSATSGQEKEEEEKEEYKEEQQQQELNSSSGRDSEFQEVIHFYRDNLQIGVSETNFNTELIIQFFEEWGKELLLAAMKLAAQKEAKGTAFVEAVLKNWKEAGVKTLEDARRYQQSFKRKSGSYYQNNKNDIVPDWYEKEKQERTKTKKESASPEEREKQAAEADRMLAEYLAQSK